MSEATRRLLKDLKKIEKEEGSGINATPVDDNNIFEWEAIIEGPEGTIWEGGLFELKLKFSENYPKQAPNISFVSPIFHPNVYSSGNICLDILSDQWSPVYDVWAVLTSIRSLLCDPNPDDPLVPDVARQYRSNKKRYIEIGKEWTRKHAME